MSYKAYKDKNGNYEIKDSKDEALEGVGKIAGAAIGGAVLAPMMAFYKLSAKNGKLLGVNHKNNSFVIFVDAKEQEFPIKTLESVNYGFGTLQFKFKFGSKISVLKISENKIIEHLTELYTMLHEKNIEVPLCADLKLYKWHKKFMRELQGDTDRDMDKIEKKIDKNDLQDIRYWKNLLDEEIITEEEFIKKKKELLNL